MPYIGRDDASGDADPPREGDRRTGNITELAIWEVPPTGQNPAGIRDRLAFVRRGEAVPTVLYDCHPPKGHHRHVQQVEEPYGFVDVEQLLADFTADVRRATGDATWPGR